MNPTGSWVFEKVVSMDGKINEGIWSNCLPSSIHEDEELCEKVNDILKMSTYVATGDEDQALTILAQATVIQAAYKFVDIDPNIWIPEMSKKMADFMLEYVKEGS